MCYKCNRIGHIARDCRMPTYQIQQQDDSNHDATYDWYNGSYDKNWYSHNFNDQQQVNDTHQQPAIVNTSQQQALATTGQQQQPIIYQIGTVKGGSVLVVGNTHAHLPLYVDRCQHWQRRTLVSTYAGSIDWKHNSTATYSTYKDHTILHAHGCWPHPCWLRCSYTCLPQGLRNTISFGTSWGIYTTTFHCSQLQMIQSKSMALGVFTTNVKDSQWVSPTLHVMWNTQSYQCQDWLIKATTSTGQTLEPSYVDHLYELHLKEMETFSTYQQNHNHLRKDGKYKQSLHPKDMCNSKLYSNIASTKLSLHQPQQHLQEHDQSWGNILWVAWK